ncbi:MAG TPA: hypothetical protein VFT50_07530 [Baekduia sp.]|nr:hypothetical protein [Baekduia sp.]
MTQRDWNADLERLLAPFRSEAAAFRALLVVVAFFATIIAIVLLIRTLT